MTNCGATRGYITTEKTVWCGGYKAECVIWEQQSAGAHLVKDWKRRGWTSTKKYGWLCPTCSANKRRVEAGR